MKFWHIALIIVGIAVGVGLVFGKLPGPPKQGPCAIVTQGPMGQHIESGAGGDLLKWDQTCPSGIRWTK